MSEIHGGGGRSSGMIPLKIHPLKSLFSRQCANFKLSHETKNCIGICFAKLKLQLQKRLT